jgi:hypothetical protein
MKGQLRRVALAAGWLVVAALVSLGAAGIVGALAHIPGTPSRAELTYPGDKAIEPGLKSAESSLQALAGDVRHLSDLGRGALTALVRGDVDALSTSVADGQQLTLQIDAQAKQIREELAALPGIGEGDELTLSAESRDRQAQALRALDATDPLAAGWSRLAVGSVAAAQVTTLLTDHDRVTGEAAALGSGAKYADALARLTESDRLIAESRTLRDKLASTVDVTTLTQWLDLNAKYDAALRRLYQAVLDSKGKVTAEVRAAFDAEAAARKRLPADTKALVIILAEIGRGGLNQAVIGIEEARGKLDAAIGVLGGIEGAGAGAPPTP